MDLLHIEPGESLSSQGEKPEDRLNELEPYECCWLRYCWAENRYIVLRVNEATFRTLLFVDWELFFRYAPEELRNLFNRKHFHFTFPDTFVTLRIEPGGEDETLSELTQSGNNARRLQFRGSRQQIGATLLEFTIENLRTACAKGYFTSREVAEDYSNFLPIAEFGISPPNLDPFFRK